MEQRQLLRLHLGVCSRAAALTFVCTFVRESASLRALRQGLGPLRVALGNRVYGALVTRLESFAEGELGGVASERARYDKLRGGAESARADYLGLRRGAEGDARLKAARALDEARGALRAQRAALARAVAHAEARRSTVLLDGAAEVAEAYCTFLRDAAAAADGFAEAARELRARAATARAASDALLASAAAAAAVHAAAAEPGGSALVAEEESSSAGPSPQRTGQNLGRSQDADIRRLLASGPGHVIKQGYLGKQARSFVGGWRRRWFVLDSAGTLSYYKDTQLAAHQRAKTVAASAVEDSAHAGAGKPGGPPALQSLASAWAPPEPPPPPPAATSAAKASSGFGGKALSFLKTKMESQPSGGAAPPSAVSNPLSSASAPAAPAEDEDEDQASSRSVNLQLSTVKLDGDPTDRSRDMRFCFRLVSPSNSLVLQADSLAERDAWVATLQGVIAEVITIGGAPKRNAAPSVATGVAAALQGGPGNGQCADCGVGEPDWASLNCGVLVCQHCAGAHRGLGTHVSKVRSIALDGHSWAPPLVSLFCKVGNAGAARAWGVGAVTTPESAAAERAAAIRAKYEARAHVAPATLHAAAAQAGALQAAAAAGDVARLLRILAAGAVVNAPVAPQQPLHAAAARGEAGAEAVALLLVWGADPLAKDADGLTAEQLAAAQGAQAEAGHLIALLRAAAAKQAA